MNFDRTLAVVFFLSTVSAVTVAVTRNPRTIPVGSLGQGCNPDGTCAGQSLQCRAMSTMFSLEYRCMPLECVQR